MEYCPRWHVKVSEWSKLLRQKPASLRETLVWEFFFWEIIYEKIKFFIYLIFFENNAFFSKLVIYKFNLVRFPWEGLPIQKEASDLAKTVLDECKCSNLSLQIKGCIACSHAPYSTTVHPTISSLLTMNRAQCGTLLPTISLSQLLISIFIYLQIYKYMICTHLSLPCTTITLSSYSFQLPRANHGCEDQDWNQRFVNVQSSFLLFVYIHLLQN